MKKFQEELTVLQDKAAAAKDIFPFMKPTHSVVTRVILRELHSAKFSKPEMRTAKEFLDAMGYHEDGTTKDSTAAVLAHAFAMHEQQHTRVLNEISKILTNLRASLHIPDDNEHKKHLSNNAVTHVQTYAIIAKNFLQRIDIETHAETIKASRLPDAQKTKLLKYLEG